MPKRSKNPEEVAKYPREAPTRERREAVFGAITEERDHQDRKWGTVEDHPHEVGSWLTIMDQLLEDAKRAWMSRRGDHGALDEIRKVAAVAVACMDQHGPVRRSTPPSVADLYMGR